MAIRPFSWLKLLPVTCKETSILSKRSNPICGLQSDLIHTFYFSIRNSAYLIHVLFNHRRQVRPWFVVAKEGTLDSPLIQDIHWVGFKCIIFVWDTNKVQQHPIPAKKHTAWQILEEWIRDKIYLWHEQEIVGNYIMNTFKSRNHGIDTSSALDTSINSTIGHFSKHLKKSKKVRKAVKVDCSFTMEKFF